MRPPAQHFFGKLRAALGGAGLVVALAASGHGMIAPTPPDLVETGTPAFVVTRPESLGLTSAPLDLHLLPDGRVLIVSVEELAIGDGVRWETYLRDPASEVANLETVAVDDDGAIYAATPNGFSRIVLGENGRWRFARVATLPDEPMLSNRTLLQTTAAGDAWYWHTGSGPVVRWRPGTTPTLIGTVNDIKRIFTAGGRTFISDASDGSLHRIVGDRLERFSQPGSTSIVQAVTCAIPLPGDRTLLGTSGVGARMLEGDRLTRFRPGGPLDGRYTINDLGVLEGGLFAAALNHLGIAIFDSDGRLVEVVDRTIQHEFGQVRRLVPGPGGTIWALLMNGVACINFPSQVSSLDTLTPAGITFSLVYRHDGRLWLVSDGRIQRAVHDADGRLVRFELDGPGAVVASLCTAFDALVACGDPGIYVREGDAWRLAIPGVSNAYIHPAPESDGWHIYAARGEVGRFRMTAAGPVVERVPTPELDTPQVGLGKAGDSYWIELGSGRAARLRLREGRPEARVFTTADGLRDSWAQLFVVDDIARLNLAGRVMRLDETSLRFVTDESFTELCGEPIAGHGRPARDAWGRIWFAIEDTVRVAGTAPGQPEPSLPNALTPILFTMQQDGVVWMHQNQRLLRYDPSLPAPTPVPFRAMISRVQLVGSGRHHFREDGPLPGLDYHDNTLAFHFLAPNAIFRKAITFEVLIEGSGDTWMATGPSGLASFPRLKDGAYVLRVRPRSGSLIGMEDRFAFTIRPPWFRTTTAYGSYVLGAIGIVAAAAWFWSLLARRERHRLEHLVARRTVELRGSEERYRRLSEELEQRVQTRTNELHRANHRLSESNRELEAFTYSVSHDLRAPLRGIDGWSHALMEDYGAALDKTAQGYIDRVRTEAQRLGQLIDDLLELSRTTRAELRHVPIDLSALATATARRVADTRPDTRVEFTCQPGLRTRGDAALLGAALFNLLDNAWKFTSRTTRPRVEFGRTDTPQGPAFFVSDNGAGFDSRHAGKLFGVFQRMHTHEEFPGTGVGLATVQRIVHRHGGRIWAESTPGVKTLFFLSLPETGE